MAQLILIRHGETLWNRLKRFQGGRSDVPLSAVGRLQAQLIANALLREPIEAVFSSPLVRARETAEAVAQVHRLHVQILPELNELDFGEYEGEYEASLLEEHGAEFTAWRNTHYTLPPSGGDSLESVRGRVAQALARMEESGAERIAVVAHQGILMALKAHLCDDYSVEAARGYKQANHQIEFWDSVARKLVKSVEVHGSYAGILLPEPG
jgi:probable phosphoglycerate mutase